MAKKKKKKKNNKKKTSTTLSTKIVKREEQKPVIYDQEKEDQLELTNEIKNVKDKKKKKKKRTKKDLSQTETIDQIKPIIELNNKPTKQEKTNKQSSKKIAKKEDVFSKITEWFGNISNSITKKNKKKITNVKKTKKTDNNNDTKSKSLPKNKFLRILVIIHRNLHILFNTVLIVSFIILILGMKRVLVIPDSTIKYIAIIVGFLGIVAISLNKYISGRIFSIIITAGIVSGIYYLNYTYDFINNYNTKLYEYQKYYVVAIDNGRNKSIYNINNKSVGLLNENATNVERVLNTKLDNVKYKKYKDQDTLYKDFYEGTYRAIIVKENQYKYLNNNNIKPGTKVKILYDFKVNAKKDKKEEKK